MDQNGCGNNVSMNQQVSWPLHVQKEQKFGFIYFVNFANSAMQISQNSNNMVYKKI